MVAEGNVGLAFGLVAAAGAATCIGACVVFVSSLAKPRFLAASLGFAAGVMICTFTIDTLLKKITKSFCTF
jgi:ZIP family zinc transporter